MKILESLPKEIIKIHPDLKSEHYIISIDYINELWGVGYRLPKNLNICLIYNSSPDLTSAVNIMEMNIHKNLMSSDYELIYK